MKKNVFSLVCVTCDSGKSGGDKSKVSDPITREKHEDGSNYKCTVNCKMKTNTKLECIESNTELAGFSIQFAQWPTDVASCSKPDIISAVSVNIPFTYGDIYKLIKYLNTKIQYNTEDLDINDCIQFTYPCNKKGCNDYEISFKLFANDYHKMMWVHISNPKARTADENTLDCLVEEGNVRLFILYLINNLFNLQYTSEEVEEIESNAF